MYEMRKKKQKEMQENKWWSYTLLAAAIFLFSQSSSVINKSMGYSLALILLSFIMHARSVDDLVKRIFKLNPSVAAKIAMIAALIIIAVICYFIRINIVYIVLLNMGAIALYVIVSAICFKLSKN